MGRGPVYERVGFLDKQGLWRLTDKDLDVVVS
jgi:hypothetical protein